MPEYPENWHEIAADIKQQATYKCENCNSLSVEKKILTVHHLDMNTSNNTYNNLVALCQKCHLSIQGKYQKSQLFLGDMKPRWMIKRGL